MYVFLVLEFFRRFEASKIVFFFIVLFEIGLMKIDLYNIYQKVLRNINYPNTNKIGISNSIRRINKKQFR